MSRLTLMFLILTISFCMAVSSHVVAQTIASQQDSKPCPEPPRSPFRYVITWNKITEGTYYPQGGKFKTRGVDVLLDEKSFSESILKQLFTLISKRFPDPAELNVSVYTSLEDMLTPEESDHAPINCILDLAKLKFRPAFYTRDNEHEQFVYQTKGQPGVLKTIVLRGKE